MISGYFQETPRVAPPRFSSLELPCHVDSFPAASRDPSIGKPFVMIQVGGRYTNSEKEQLPRFWAG